MRVSPFQLCLAVAAAHGYYAKAQSAQNQSFDYVIVGGGPAGLVLANRLTENPSVTAVLIEAGGYASSAVGNTSAIPGLDFEFLATPVTPDMAEMEWGFNTTPQDILKGSPMAYTRAKALGGCTDVNFMAYGQSSYGVFQRWADMVDDQSYTYPNISRYYRKSMNFQTGRMDERYANATPTFDKGTLVQEGPLGVSFPAFAQSFSTWMARGLEAAGIPARGALTDGTLNGATWQMSTIDGTTGFRSSAEAAFLQPALQRSNLVVLNGTMAEKIVFDRNKTARGVVVTTGSTTYQISAAREVIVSAGVFQSPQLLMVSGVGPAAVLDQHDIAVVADLPGVGQGMNDHVMIGVSYEVDLVTGSTATQGDKFVLASEAFATNKTGPLSNPGGDYVAMEKLPAAYTANMSSAARDTLASYPEDWPDVEFLVNPGFAGNQNTPNAGSKNLPETRSGANYGTLLAVVQIPQSRGNVTISSASMADPPVINPAWLTDPRDREFYIAAFRRTRDILGNNAVKPVLIGEEFYPGPSVQTDDEIMDYIATSFGVLYHASATNPMGRAGDQRAVVGSTGKVFGTTNLRVVDASIFPFLPPGPAPQTMVYALAEKIADDIKAGR